MADITVEETFDSESKKFKCPRTVIRQGESKALTFESAQDAKGGSMAGNRGHPIAAAIFEVTAGPTRAIERVFMMENTVTVTKTDFVEWDQIEGQILEKIKGSLATLGD
jgi:hypothetical protein